MREIKVTYGKGEGLSNISAFDSALWDAGIGNYNIIRLSSIIPQGSKIEVKKVDYNKLGNGNRLYVVLSNHIVDIPGNEAWAGLGWIQANDQCGIFIEHHGIFKEKVIKSIKEELDFMKEYRNMKFTDSDFKIEGILCEDKPVCALVCALFKMERW